MHVQLEDKPNMRHDAIEQRLFCQADANMQLIRSIIHKQKK